MWRRLFPVGRFPLVLFVYRQQRMHVKWISVPPHCIRWFRTLLMLGKGFTWKTTNSSGFSGMSGVKLGHGQRGWAVSPRLCRWCFGLSRLNYFRCWWIYVGDADQECWQTISRTWLGDKDNNNESLLELISLGHFVLGNFRLKKHESFLNRKWFC